MKLYVGFKVFETIVDPRDINRIRGTFGERMQVMGPSIESGGIFADARQGYVVLNVSSEDEVFGLLGEIADFCTMEVHPLVSFETLGRYFAERGPA